MTNEQVRLCLDRGQRAGLGTVINYLTKCVKRSKQEHAGCLKRKDTAAMLYWEIALRVTSLHRAAVVKACKSVGRADTGGTG